MSDELRAAAEAELGVFVDEAYELLRLSLAEREAREEIELLDDLMLLQTVQLRVAKGRAVDPMALGVLKVCMLRMKQAAELLRRRWEVLSSANLR